MNDDAAWFRASQEGSGRALRGHKVIYYLEFLAKPGGIATNDDPRGSPVMAMGTGAHRQSQR